MKGTPEFVAVRARPGRTVPINPADGGTTPGGAVRRLVSDPDQPKPRPERVRFSVDTRRAVARGDLCWCNMDGQEVESYELAAWEEPPVPPASAELPMATITSSEGPGGRKGGLK